jgi:hypothetical protein
MRLLFAMLIATLAGVGMGYWHGFAEAVHRQQNYARPMFKAEEFADPGGPATRPMTRPTALPPRPPTGR